MSAVAIIPTASGIVAAADGALYEEATGKVGGFMGKLFLMPHLDCVFGYVGSGGFGEALLHNIRGAFDSFDELVKGIAVKCQFTHLLMERGGLSPAGAYVIVVVGGWSEERQRFEAWKVHSADKVAIVDGERVEHAAWRLHAIEGAWVSTTPPADVMTAFGLLEGEHSALDYAALLVCACRAVSGADVDDERFYGVGGFLQLALVEAGKATTWIAHRWPDPLGEPIDPARGEPRPPLPIHAP